MPNATFRFYEELNDFLPKSRRKVDFHAEFIEKKYIKDVIEAFGVPSLKIDLILVNGASVGFQYILQDGDRVSVYPVFETFNIEKITRLRKVPLRKTRFIADETIDGTAAYMRLLGFDVYLDPSLADREIIRISKKENRIILTRRKKLLKFKGVTHGIVVCRGTPEDQIKQIVDRLDIKGCVFKAQRRRE